MNAPCGGMNAPEVLRHNNYASRHNHMLELRPLRMPKVLKTPSVHERLLMASWWTASY